MQSLFSRRLLFDPDSDTDPDPDFGGSFRRARAAAARPFNENRNFAVPHLRRSDLRHPLTPIPRPHGRGYLGAASSTLRSGESSAGNHKGGSLVGDHYVDSLCTRREAPAPG